MLYTKESDNLTRYKITKITDKEGTDKTEGKYPLRIGRKCLLYSFEIYLNVPLVIRYDPDKGEILFNHQDIREYDVEQYRHSFGTLFQDFQIYGATLGENVKTDRVSETDKQIILRSLKTAGLEGVISDIDTQLTREYDKEGQNVSGGEAQKIALSRVFIKNPHTYILDEPTSALDPISEYNFNKKIVEVSKGKTVIFISHRLSTTRMADRIYVLEKGEVIESGSHDELIAQGGKYAHMFKIQAEKYTKTVCE
jgi:ATP-binding cassette subfamily B protein